MTQDGFKRKLVAILSADVEGYSRLMGQNEEQTIRTLTSYRTAISDLVQQYRGRVVDTPGDNILAEFSSVVDAVNSAVKIQSELTERNTELPMEQRMQFRIGVNLGDVVDEEGRIYGDGVNIAARVESMAEAGGICISDRAYDQVENKLPFKYEDLGEHRVKNIRRPIGIYKVLMEADESEALSLPDKPSIAVLPFVNMSGDPNQEYFSDGITEQIITGISRIRDLFVIARNSSFSYKGKAVKVQQVGRDLGVRYVLEGSIQKSGERVRVTAQLIDAITGHHLWAETYDRDLEDIFAIQDEITMNIIHALQIELTDGEQWRHWEGQTQNIRAFLFQLQGIEYLSRFTKDDIFQARKFLEKAIELDPNFPAPYATLGWSHLIDIFFGWSESFIESFEKAEKLAQKTLSLNDSMDFAHSLMSQIYLFKRQHDSAIEEAKRATVLIPNGAQAYTWLGFTLTYSSKSKEAISILKKAIRLNPFPPGYFYDFLGFAYRVAGQYEEALKAYKMAINNIPNALPVLLGMISCYINLDRPVEAQKTASEVMKTKSDFSLEWYSLTMPYKNQSDLDRDIESLRRAGLPD
jgi:adenylate cyclase